MKSDSPKRRQAIIHNTNPNKIHPLANWNKFYVNLFIKGYKIKHSKIYDDRILSNGTIIHKSNSSGCDFCHYGNDGHYCTINGVKQTTTKLENLKREFPKKYESGMKMKHKSGITYREVLDNYYDAKDGNQLEKSIIVRNNFINRIINYMLEDDRDFTKPIAYIKTFII